MSELENTTVTTPEETTAEQQERTFTQAELDSIVKERLSRERGKYADYEEIKAKAAKFDEVEEANKTELQKATERAQALEAELNGMKKAESIRTIRDMVASETGVPASLLTADTEEECKAQAQSILSFAKPQSYPTIKDGGEVNNVGKPTTRQQFADWANNAFN